MNTQGTGPSTSVHERPRVLVVDDDQDLLVLARAMLREDFDVITASGGRECLDLARAELPDVIVLDMMMPEMDGATVLEALGADPVMNGISVICLSALGRVEDRVSGLEGGAVDYMVKPFDQRELIARIRAADRRKPGADGAHDVAEVTSAGLSNKAAFERRLSEEVARSKRNLAAFSILLVEVDSPAQAIRELGPESEDVLIGRLARAMQSNLRLSDALFRYATGAFAVVLPDTDAGTAWVASERLRHSVAGMEYGGLELTVSVGIAEYGGHRSGEDLVERARAALTKARQSGGNMSWRSDDPRRRALNPMALAEELTDREWDVLAHLAQRRTEREIGLRLGISSGTVRSHKARIRRKLHVPPEVRLSDYVRTNFKDISEKLGPDGEPPSTEPQSMSR